MPFIRRGVLRLVLSARRHSPRSSDADFSAGTRKEGSEGRRAGGVEPRGGRCRLAVAVLVLSFTAIEHSTEFAVAQSGGWPGLNETSISPEFIPWLGPWGGAESPEERPNVAGAAAGQRMDLISGGSPHVHNRRLLTHAAPSAPSRAVAFRLQMLRRTGRPPPNARRARAFAPGIGKAPSNEDGANKVPPRSNIARDQSRFALAAHSHVTPGLGAAARPTAGPLDHCHTVRVTPLKRPQSWAFRERPA
jgi:hypothetical protein